MQREPHGEERDDLRIGALASVIWNCNLDTKSMGGMIEPRDYVSGWNRERVGVFALRPKQVSTESKPTSGLDLSNPIDWENFTTGLIKSVGGKQAPIGRGRGRGIGRGKDN